MIFSRIIFFLKAILKGCYINNTANLILSKTSWIGKHVSIYTSSNSKIVLGEHVKVGHFSELSPIKKGIEIKDYTTLNTGCKILGEVTLERYCLLGPNIFISSGNHETKINPPILIRKQDVSVRDAETSQHVHIEEDVWIGVGAFIKRGVKVGRGAIIGANAVVLTNIAPYEIFAGNPAKKIGNRLIFTPKTKIEASRESDLPYFYRGFDHLNIEDKNISQQIGLMCYKSCCAVLSTTKSISKAVIKGFLKETSKKITVTIGIGNETNLYTIDDPVFILEIPYPQDVKLLNSNTVFITFETEKNFVLGINSIELAG